MDQSLFIKSEELIARGWTRLQINKRIGEPDEIVGGGGGYPPRYYWLRERVDKLTLPPKRVIKSPVEVDLLQAVFTVNRSAKRYRDAAQSCYCTGVHSFARVNKNKKVCLYALKDRGIAAAYRTGRLVFAGVKDRMSLYRGEGYVFHSSLIPVDSVNVALDDSGDYLTVPAKAKSSGETRLSDAEYTLGLTPQMSYEGFRSLELPKFNRRPTQFRDEDDEDDEENQDW